MTDCERGRREGLSPRRRGNLGVSLVFVRYVGPIPAQAGEPSPPRSSPPRTRAYPRAGGGTGLDLFGQDALQGLSPRRRGNLLAVHREAKTIGPIPAQAGEPRPVRPASTPIRAYPRAGGGTTSDDTLLLDYQGLSPRRRGNLLSRGAGWIMGGPIPAQAGEPRGLTVEPERRWAYPRAGGGTRPG